MTKPAILFFFAYCLIFWSSAQPVSKPERYKSNIIYPELWGNGLEYSINYERIFKQAENYFFSTRIGYGIVPLYHSGGAEQTIPLEFIWVKGEKHHFEYGIGITTVFGYSSYSARQVSFIPAPRIGYRYQAPGRHFMLRAGVAALFTNSYNNASDPFLYPCIAIGLAL